MTKPPSHILLLSHFVDITAVVVRNPVQTSSYNFRMNDVDGASLALTLAVKSQSHNLLCACTRMQADGLSNRHDPPAMLPEVASIVAH